MCIVWTHCLSSPSGNRSSHLQRRQSECWVVADFIQPILKGTQKYCTHSPSGSTQSMTGGQGALIQKTVLRRHTVPSGHAPLFMSHDGSQKASPVASNTSHRWPLRQRTVAQGSGGMCAHKTSASSHAHGHRRRYDVDYCLPRSLSSITTVATLSSPSTTPV